jgi:hypothetical protein
MGRNDGQERSRRNDRPVWLVAAAVTALLAAGSCSCSAWQIAKNRRFLSESVLVRGTVIGSAPGAVYSVAPLVRYEVDGRSYEIRGRTSSRPPSYSRGDAVVVRYRPGRPGEGRIDSFEELWLPALAFIGVGVVMCGFCAMSVLAARTPDRPVEEPPGDKAGDPEVKPG